MSETNWGHLRWKKNAFTLLSKPTEFFLLFYLFKNPTCDNIIQLVAEWPRKMKDRESNPRNWANPFQPLLEFSNLKIDDNVDIGRSIQRRLGSHQFLFRKKPRATTRAKKVVEQGGGWKRWIKTSDQADPVSIKT